MQGISYRKHRHLLLLLQQMEAILEDTQDKPALLEEVRKYHKKLDSQHEAYLSLLEILAGNIQDYEQLFERIRVELVGKKLKKLLKDMKGDRMEYPILIENIRLAYGT
ncbi:hypothetical protein [Desertivirga xinjiangensis]|uniref:hypothetical protein n=1 Tax=Desertivirga xinjiangensis TaxID=539206 RepID=UPI00210CD105|nr:hypothetical protein [Pedobacter xinjiangensis]